MIIGSLMSIANRLLLFSAKLNSSVICKLALTLGPNEESFLPNDKSPLHIAAKKGHTDIIKILLKSGMMDINLKTSPEGETPLHYAIKKNNIDIAKILIDSGANINEPDIKGTTPLHLAASEAERIDIMKLLIKNGADVNAKMVNNGYTPLDISALTNNQKAAQYLIDNGANTNISARLIEHLVERGERENIATMLIKNGANFTRKSLLSINGAHSNELSTLSKAGEYILSLYDPSSKNLNIDANDQEIKGLVKEIIKNRLANERDIKALDRFKQEHKDSPIVQELDDKFKKELEWVIEKRKITTPESAKLYKDLSNGLAYSGPEIDQNSSSEQLSAFKKLCRLEGINSCKKLADGIYLSEKNNTLPTGLVTGLKKTLSEAVEDTLSLEQNIRKFVDGKFVTNYMDYIPVKNEETNSLNDFNKIDGLSPSPFLKALAKDPDLEITHGDGSKTKFKELSEQDQIIHSGIFDRVGDYISSPEILNKIKASRSQELREFLVGTEESIEKSGFIGNIDKYIIPEAFKKASKDIWKLKKSEPENGNPRTGKIAGLVDLFTRRARVSESSMNNSPLSTPGRRQNNDLSRL